MRGVERASEQRPPWQVCLVFLDVFWPLCGSYHDRYSDELLTLITEELAQVKKLRVLDLSRNHVRPADRTTACAKLAGRVLVICVDR